MANIQSINSNPIVVGTSGIEDGAVTMAKLASDVQIPQPTDAQVEDAVDAWLTAHPEATTTVQDSTITTAKLADGAVTDAKLAQSGGVLSDIKAVSDLLNVNSTTVSLVFEVGAININTGQDQAWASSVRSVGYTRLVGKYLTTTAPDGYRINVYKYDAAKNFLGWDGLNVGTNSRDMTGTEFIRIVVVKHTATEISPELVAGTSVTMASEQLINANEAIAEAKNVMNDDIGVYYGRFAHSSSGGHSANIDLVQIDVASGEIVKFIVETSNGDSLNGYAVFRGTDSTTVFQKQFTTNVMTTVTATGVASSVGVYLPAASSACDVYVKVYSSDSVLTAVERTDAISNQLDSYYSTWNAAAGTTHSSTADHVDVSVSAGDMFYASVNTSDRETLTGTLVAFDSAGTSLYTIGGITTNSILKFVATSDFEKVGVYLPAVESDCVVYLNIIKGDSLYKLNVDGENEVPSYWIDNLNSAIQKVADLQTYESGVTFGFITDIHWETNHQVSPKLVDYINRNSRVDMWINGGDTASGDNGNGAQQKRWLYDCIGKFGNGYEFYSINGNHDPNYIGGQTNLTSGEIRNVIMPYGNEVTFGDGNYYWFDYRGTRFVCLDTGWIGSSDQAQVSWAADVIASSPLPVIVAMHIVKISYDSSSPCPMFTDLIVAVGSNSNLKMIIGGHEHHDYTFVASNGTPVVVLDTDSRFADDGVTRVRGTTSEQCLSIVTIDYAARKINVTRVGTIGQDIELTYS